MPEEYGIAFRPEIVKTRDTYGHWEGDLIIFARKEGSKSNVTSLIERKSRYTILAKTMTFDRGFEFMSYPLLRKKLKIRTYFCDPQAPWQKGAVECNNNRIRRFLPRDIDLDSVTDRDLQRIENIMNDTPRRCLGYRTPREVFENARASI